MPLYLILYNVKQNKKCMLFLISQKKNLSVAQSTIFPLIDLINFNYTFYGIEKTYISGTTLEMFYTQGGNHKIFRPIYNTDTVIYLTCFKSFFPVWSHL